MIRCFIRSLSTPSLLDIDADSHSRQSTPRHTHIDTTAATEYCRRHELPPPCHAVAACQMPWLPRLRWLPPLMATLYASATLLLPHYASAERHYADIGPNIADVFVAIYG